MVRLLTAAEHIVAQAKSCMAPSEYDRMVEILKAYQHNIIHKPVAEYLLMDMMRVDENLYRDMTMFLWWCNWSATGDVRRADP